MSGRHDLTPLIAPALLFRVRQNKGKIRGILMSVGASSKLAAFWNHPAGPKTIHFWAPTFKCAINHVPTSRCASPHELQWSNPHTAASAAVAHVIRTAVQKLLRLWADTSPTMMQGALASRILQVREAGAPERQ